jgi:hypothetical protein
MTDKTYRVSRWQPEFAKQVGGYAFDGMTRRGEERSNRGDVSINHVAGSAVKYKTDASSAKNSGDSGRTTMTVAGAVEDLPFRIRAHSVPVGYIPGMAQRSRVNGRWTHPCKVGAMLMQPTSARMLRSTPEGGASPQPGLLAGVEPCQILPLCPKYRP